MRVKLQWKMNIGTHSTLEQIIELTATSPYLKFDTKVNWKANRKSLKVAFKSEVLARNATFDTQFGHINRSTHNNTSWDSAQYEVCGHKWASIQEHGLGFAVFNDSKYGWQVKEGCITLSLLRSPKAPDDNCDMGQHSFSYGLMPYNGNFQANRIPERAYEFNVKPMFLNKIDNINRFDGSFFNIVGDGVMLETIKPTYDIENALVVRGYEFYGGTQHVW